MSSAIPLAIFLLAISADEPVPLTSPDAAMRSRARIAPVVTLATPDNGVGPEVLGEPPAPDERPPSAPVLQNIAPIIDPNTVSVWGYIGLPQPHQPPGDMHQHVPYVTHTTYHYFRPYNFFHVADHQKEVLDRGGDPRNPYDNTVFQRIYAAFESETVELPAPLPH